MATKSSSLPLTRIQTIMKSCSDVVIVGKEASTIMCKATEHFIRLLTNEAYQYANNDKLFDYKHLTQVVHNNEKYEFLTDIVPKKITVLEFKRILARKERQVNGQNDSTSEDDEDASSSNEDSN